MALVRRVLGVVGIRRGRRGAHWRVGGVGLGRDLDSGDVEPVTEQRFLPFRSSGEVMSLSFFTSRSWPAMK